MIRKLRDWLLVIVALSLLAPTTMQAAVGTLRGALVQVNDGSVAAPSYSFENEPGLGLYRIGTNEGGWSQSFAIRGPRPYTDVRAHQATGNGTTDDRAAIAAADTVAGASGNLRFTAGTYRIASNLTIASVAWFDNGAILSPDAGVTVTFSQPIQAGLYKIFTTGAGTVAFSKGPDRIFPQWWGAKGDGGTDDTAAIQSTVNVATTGQTVLFSCSSVYLVNLPIVIPTTNSGMQVVGCGSYSRLAESNTNLAIIRAGASFPATGGMFRNSSATPLRSITFRDIIVDGNSKAQYGLDLANIFSAFLDNITVMRATSHGIYQDGTTYPGPGPIGRRVIAYLNGGDGVRISTSIGGAYFTNLFSGANTGKGASFIGATEGWLTAPELDGNADVGLYVNNSSKISVEGGWIGDNGGTTIQQVTIVGASIDISLNGVKINKTTSSNGLTLIQIDNVTRMSLVGNILTFSGTGINQTVILIGAGSQVTGLVIIGNTFQGTTAGTTGVSASDNGGTATLTDIRIIGNIMGSVTTPIYLAGISAANRARFVARDNAGFNPQAVAAITVTASPFTYTNQDGYPEEVTVAGGTVSAISVRGTTLTNVTGGVFMLYPGDAIVVTYTGAPTMQKIPQ